MLASKQKRNLKKYFGPRLDLKVRKSLLNLFNLFITLGAFNIFRSIRKLSARVGEEGFKESRYPAI